MVVIAARLSRTESILVLREEWIESILVFREGWFWVKET